MIGKRKAKAHRPLPAGLTADQIARRLRSRKAAFKWCGKPPGMSAALVLKFEKRIHEGRTITDLTFPKSKWFLVPSSRWQKHCELNPAWAANIYKLGRANVAKKLQRVSGRGRQAKYVCLNGGHPMKGNNVRIVRNRGRIERRCRACHYRTMHGKPMTEETKAKIIAALKRGDRLRQFLHGQPFDGGPRDRSLIITSPAKFYHQREIDPDFAKIVDKYIPANTSIGQTLRYAKDAPAEMKPVLINLARLRHKIKAVRQQGPGTRRTKAPRKG
jgi:hypothetical protein